MLTLLGTLIVIVFTAWLNTRVMAAKIDALNARFDGVDKRFDGVDKRFESIDRRLDAINTRFDDMRDLWRAELHRVEEVLDARLKHLEDR
jgi:predicted ATPase